MSDVQVDPTDYLDAMERGSFAERLFHRRRVRLLRAVVPWPGRLVLDVGAGSGCLSLPLAEEGAKVTALEPGEEHLDRLVARAAERGLDVETVVGEGGSIPFDDASFDVVLLASVVHLLVRPGPLLAEAERVCRADGRIVVAGPWHLHPKSNRWIKTVLRGGRPPTKRTFPVKTRRLRRLLPGSTLLDRRIDRAMGYVATVWVPDRKIKR
jgi:ubiquinone/menaquinone biosynthesis C-methylase UbiE